MAFCWGVISSYLSGLKRSPTRTTLLGSGACFTAEAGEGLKERIGSIPLFSIGFMAPSDARNAINRLADSRFFEPATAAAVNTETYWTSLGRVPTKSEPGTCKISLTG